MIPEEEVMRELEKGGLDGEGGRMSDWERMNSSSGSSSLGFSRQSIEGEAVFIVVVEGDTGVRGEGRVC